MNLPHGLKFDQLAVCVGNGRAQEQITKQGTWAEDVVTTIGRGARGERISNVARLRFNYVMWPMEYEVLQYISGWNWPEHFGLLVRDETRISHYGVHIQPEQREAFVKRWECVQDSVTLHHVNPAVPGLRRYRYSIFDARNDCGTFVKTITRLDMADGSFEKALEDIRWGSTL